MVPIEKYLKINKTIQYDQMMATKWPSSASVISWAMIIVSPHKDINQPAY